MKEYFIFSILWIFYFFFHSLLISLWAVERAKKYLGKGYRFYRLFYVVFSILSLIPVIYYKHSISKQVIFEWSGGLNFLRVILLVICGLLALLAFRKYDLLQFFGIRQISSGKTHRILSKEESIQTKGILGFIRHPLYSALFVLIWLRNIDDATIIENILISLYLVIGTVLEEQKLVVEFGESYEKYKKSVSMFFPWKWIRNKISGPFR